VDDAFEDFLNNESLYPKEEVVEAEVGVDDQEKEEDTVDHGENQILKGVRVNMPDIIYFEEEINKL